MDNKLFDCFPRCFKLLDYKTIEKEKLEAYYNSHIKTGHIRIQYYYCGLYVLFMGKIENRKGKKQEKYRIYSRFSGSDESQIIDPETILNEDIPSFNPLRQILKQYSLHEMIKIAYCNIDYDDYD